MNPIRIGSWSFNKNKKIFYFVELDDFDKIWREFVCIRYDKLRECLCVGVSLCSALAKIDDRI